MSVATITSRDNALLVRVRRLAQDPGAYRRLGQVWIEGEHLCSAWLERGGAGGHALIAEDAWAAGGALADLARSAARTSVVAGAAFRTLSALESPPRIGFLVELPPAPAVAPGLAAVVLDRLQDAGNVGSVLRSAAAFGFGQVLALRGTAALWSPKVLRAGMGAHFALRLVEGLEAPSLDALAVPLVATSSHDGVPLRTAALAMPCAFVLGHEGQGVAAEVAARCALRVRIPQPGGEESLNVAAAAAILCYEAASR